MKCSRGTCIPQNVTLPPPPPSTNVLQTTSDISKEYPEYSNGDLHTQRLPGKIITTDRAPSPTQINPRNNYSNQIYYISKMQTYEITRKTCSPDYLATVMDDHTNETVPQSVLTEHGLTRSPAICIPPPHAGTNVWKELIMSEYS